MIRYIAQKLGMTPTSLLASIAIHAVVIAAILGFSSSETPINSSPNSLTDQIDERDVIEISFETGD